MKILYFAWMRQHIGTGMETFRPDPQPATVGELMQLLKTRSEGHARAFADTDSVRMAVNKEFADAATPLHADDEVAFFPPVTGG